MKSHCQRHIGKVRDTHQGVWNISYLFYFFFFFPEGIHYFRYFKKKKGKENDNTKENLIQWNFTRNYYNAQKSLLFMIQNIKYAHFNTNYFHFCKLFSIACLATCMECKFRRIKKVYPPLLLASYKEFSNLQNLSINKISHLI